MFVSICMYINCLCILCIYIHINMYVYNVYNVYIYLCIHLIYQSVMCICILKYICKSVHIYTHMYILCAHIQISAPTPPNLSLLDLKIFYFACNIYWNDYRHGWKLRLLFFSWQFWKNYNACPEFKFIQLQMANLLYINGKNSVASSISAVLFQQCILIPRNWSQEDFTSGQSQRGVPFSYLTA